MKRIITPIYVILGLFGFYQSASSEDLVYSIKSIYVFGDSLSDTGNYYKLTNGLAPPSMTPHQSFWQGRFSNGPIALEYLWSDLGVHSNAFETVLIKPSLLISNFNDERAVSFAYGGAGSGTDNLTPDNISVPGLLGQVNNFLANVKNIRHKDALYAIWIGANDYLLLNGNPEDVVANIGRSIIDLYAAGARKFIILNLPDLGSPPILDDPILKEFLPGREELTKLTVMHNTRLALELRRIKSQYSDLKIFDVDIFSFFNQLRTILNVDKGPAGNCLFIDITACTDVSNFLSNGFLFWDVQHPTTGANMLMSQQMVNNILRSSISARRGKM